jgi:hypothetical protein
MFLASDQAGYITVLAAAAQQREMPTIGVPVRGAPG